MKKAYGRLFSSDQHKTDQHAKVGSTEFRRKQSFPDSGGTITTQAKDCEPHNGDGSKWRTVQSTHDGALDIPVLPPSARYEHVIPGIKHSLLSIVRLCNVGCEIVFGKWGVNVEVQYKGKVAMKDRKSTINMVRADHEDHQRGYS